MTSTQQKKMISICVPVLNEEATLDKLYETLEPLLKEHQDTYDFEIIFTDNHSTDRTFEKLKALSERDPRIRVFDSHETLVISARS